jgi:hypothetical protein
VAGHIAQRRQAIRAWAAKNPDFAGAMVLEFEKFKQAAKN